MEQNELNFEDYANEKIKLIKGISGVNHTPRIVEGEFSSTGKTISVEVDGTTYRIDTEDILVNNFACRRATTFELYTKENMKAKQNANYGPGPQAGTNGASDDEDLPEPTHTGVEA